MNEGKAFQFLVRISQDSNVKLREVAADIVAGVNRVNLEPSSKGLGEPLRPGQHGATIARILCLECGRLWGQTAATVG